MRQVDTNTFPRTLEELEYSLNNGRIEPSFETILRCIAVIGSVQAHKLIYERIDGWIQRGNVDEPFSMGEIAEFCIHFDRFRLFKYFVETHFEKRREFVVRHKRILSLMETVKARIDESVNDTEFHADAIGRLRALEERFADCDGDLNRLRNETDSMLIITVKSGNNLYLEEFRPYVISISNVIELVETYGTTLYE